MWILNNMDRQYRFFDAEGRRVVVEVNEEFFVEAPPMGQLRADVKNEDLKFLPEKKQPSSKELAAFRKRIDLLNREPKTAGELPAGSDLIVQADPGQAAAAAFEAEVNRAAQSVLADAKQDTML